MARFVYLSHVIDPKDNAFPGEPVVEVAQDSVISDTGKPFNSAMIHLPNHFGTHIDAPHHFNPDGINMIDVPIETFGYLEDEILVLDLPHRGEPKSVIVMEDLEPFKDQIKGKGIILFRTGFERFKFTDPHTYEYEGVSFHPEVCKWLVEECPELRCIGMDWLSIGSPSNDYGVEAHWWLLGKFTEHYVCGIEDMTLAALGDSKIKVLTLGPLRVVDVDSAQVNVMALVDD